MKNFIKILNQKMVWVDIVSLVWLLNILFVEQIKKIIITKYNDNEKENIKIYIRRWFGLCREF